MSNTEPYIDKKQCARQLGVSVPTIESWVYAKKIPHYKIGRLLKFKASEVDEYFKKDRVAPEDENAS